MNKPNIKKDLAEIEPSAKSSGLPLRRTNEDNPTKSRRKLYRRPRLNEAIEALRQLNLECEVAKLEALGKAASLRLIKRKIQALLREVTDE